MKSDNYGPGIHASDSLVLDTVREYVAREGLDVERIEIGEYGGVEIRTSTGRYLETFVERRRSTLSLLRANAERFVARTKAHHEKLLLEQQPCTECALWGGPPVNGEPCGACGARDNEAVSKAARTDAQEILGRLQQSIAASKRSKEDEPKPFAVGGVKIGDRDVKIGDRVRCVKPAGASNITFRGVEGTVVEPALCGNPIYIRANDGQMFWASEVEVLS